ncbi:MAG: gamma-glutamyl-gamma-aminobutyrate hydrolase family protein [Lachnospiraceae bacterium]|uniref:gamma-glutamyl-gamma-aminobutyrate hydrolase family protein n=1 Tax=Clostridium sp. WB02_MRS01 TaxID=2605777 RepID=UPI0012B29AAB|nr:gamma-glutamyl-gamma-aminobutyrate hydrolase family protein [Clostridium sp. WB02_MRS01]MBW4844038.1 gamma-glutamyl-gamma-aminobutyrate hydrolase family protein [Lachnospiraceae bacterium]MSS11659.1 gamma-glutamyl-gamma-aminobutyrate hydrolase family protein [Clostridium sp. WB02_MRS01]
MRKPLIGLTPAHDMESGDVKARPTYMRALKAAGAIPVVMPLDASEEDLKQLSQDLDGFLFTGGPDVHPFLFGEETQAHCGNVSPARDKMEISLLPMIMELQKPILGICRGIQVLNIALGGNIWQDIPSQVTRDFPLAHSQPFSYDMPCHTVVLTEGSLLARISESSSIKVNSMHHQAVKDLAPGLIASAYSTDYLIEALEMPDYPFFIGVQWHPEYLWEKNKEAFRLFQTFVKACKE